MPYSRYRFSFLALLLLLASPIGHSQPAGDLAHPRLLADPADIARARIWMRQSPWYRSIIEEHRREIDAFIARGPIFVSPVKQVYRYKMYTCPTHDVELLYEESRPFDHRCPKDTTESVRGPAADAAWSGWYNRRLAEHLVWMGILYQLTGEGRYATAGREILVQFADLYLRYPTANTILGPAHVFFGTLSESFWGVDMAYGYDLLYSSSVFTADDHRKLRDSLFIPLAQITQQFPESASNRQLWYNNVSAAVGFLYGDQELINFALHGTYGFNWQLGSALPPSGFWPEWSGYHFVALRGMIHLAEMARHNGLDLYHVVIAGRSMKSMFDSPLDMILPNFEFPRNKDSGGGNLLEYAVFYEVGYAVYRDPRYLSLLNLSTLKRGTQVVAEESGLGRSLSPITIFNLVPDLPPDTSALYRSGSVNLTGNGCAILRSGSGDERRYLYLDYGIMGGEHGHPDRLQIGYYARGRNWIVDPLNESYFNPNLQLWYRQTIAHNTLVVDQTSQTWANGRGRFFGSLPGFQAASGASQTVYPGALLTRTVIDLGEYFIDLFDVNCSEPRILDLPLHGDGSVTLTGVRLSPEPHDRFGHEPGIPGYDQLRDVQSGTTDGAWKAVFTARDGEHLSVLTVGEPGTRVFTATTPPLGGFYKQMVKDQTPRPMIFSRRLSARTRFAHLLHAHGGEPRILGFTKLEDGYRVKTVEGTDDIRADVDRSIYTIVRTAGDSPTFCAGFNVHEIRHDGRLLVSSPHPLGGITCTWTGNTLLVDHRGALSALSLYGPGIDTVRINGKTAPFLRHADSTITVRGSSPFLEVVSPSDSVVFAGTAKTIRLRVWNPTEAPLRGALSVRAADDWYEHVVSQRDWWGGVVNLLPLARATHRSVVFPEAPRVAADWLEHAPGDSLAVAPGGFTDIALRLTVPPDIQPAAYPVVLRFGNVTMPWQLHALQPLDLHVSLPSGPKTLLRVLVRNSTPDSQTVHLEVTPSAGWTLRGRWSQTVSLAGAGQRAIELPCGFNRGSSGNRPFTVSVDARAGRFRTTVVQDLYVAVAHPAPPSISLDGSWRGWNRSSPVRIDSSYQRSKLLLGNQPWGGRSDLSAEVYVMYDSTSLYVGADVLDDSVITHWDFPAMSYPWDTDCMEVVLDTRTGSNQKTDPPTPGAFRHLSMAEYRATEFGPERWQGGGAGGPLLPKPLLVPGAETYWKRTPGGYSMICKYPGHQSGFRNFASGSTIGFDVALSDNDGTTYRRNMFIWAGFTMNQSWWDLGTIGTLVFAGSGKQP